MSEAGTESTQDGNEGGATSAAQEFAPITSQEALDKIVGKRIERERAKFSDYDELKAKAGQLDVLSQASQSAEDKLNDRIAQLENQAAQAELAALRSKYAADIPEKLRPLLTGTTEEELASQRDLLAEQASAQSKQGIFVPTEGTSTRPAGTQDGAFARSLLSGD